KQPPEAAQVGDPLRRNDIDGGHDRSEDEFEQEAEAGRAPAAVVRSVPENASGDRLQELHRRQVVITADVDEGVDQVEDAGDQRGDQNWLPELHPIPSPGYSCPAV